MSKIIYIFSYLTILIALGLMFLAGFWLLYPYKVVEFKNSPYPIMNENKTVKKGEDLIYQVDACKYLNAVPDLTRFFIDGIIYETPKSVGAVEMGCHIQDISITVPKAIPTGVYKMKFIARYKVNPIRVIEYVNYSQSFMVIN